MKKSPLWKLTGRTPLIKISDRLYAKLETYNPTGSVKDRMVSYVVDRAIESGEINKSHTTLCEATSGNTGIALSAVAASLGFECVIFMPKNMSEERRQMMRVYGAKIIDAPADDFDAAIAMRDEFLSTNEQAWSPMQFSNPVNIECHRIVTAREIHSQVQEISWDVDWSAFVHGSGTGGTIEGIRQYCAYNEIDTRVVMTVPAEAPHGIQGIGDGRDFLAHPDKMDDVMTVKTQSAIDRAQQFAKSTGILVGISSGANLIASEMWIKENDPQGVVVTMLCDRGERYMSVYGEK
jgi:cysteine synthase